MHSHSQHRPHIYTICAIPIPVNLVMCRNPPAPTTRTRIRSCPLCALPNAELLDSFLAPLPLQLPHPPPRRYCAYSGLTLPSPIPTPFWSLLALSCLLPCLPPLATPAL